jgi:hypothetical protein
MTIGTAIAGVLLGIAAWFAAGRDKRWALLAVTIGPVAVYLVLLAGVVQQSESFVWDIGRLWGFIPYEFIGYTCLTLAPVVFGAIAILTISARHKKLGAPSGVPNKRIERTPQALS